MTAQGIMAELIAHRSVQAFEPFPHIDGFDRKVDFGGQPDTEQHRQQSRAFGNPDQPGQLFLTKPPGAFNAPPIRQAKREALPCRFPLRHFYLHQSRLGAKLTPPIIKCRERDATLTTELAPRHSAGKEFLDHPPHLGSAIGWLAHAAHLRPIRRRSQYGFAARLRRTRYLASPREWPLQRRSLRLPLLGVGK